MIRPKRDKSVIVSPIITRNQTAVCLSPRLHNSLHPLSGTMKKSINYHCVRKRQDLNICSELGLPAPSAFTHCAQLGCQTPGRKQRTKERRPPSLVQHNVLVLSPAL